MCARSDNITRMVSEETFDHHEAVVGDTRLHYVREGDGSPLVLLHGWPQTWYEWRHVIPELAREHTVIAPDLPGLGTSNAPTRSYEKADIADDIHALVRELGFESVSIVGHDIGGMVAYAYAAAHRSAVDRLVLTELLLPGFGLEELMTPDSHFRFHMQADAVASLRGREKEYITEYLRRGLYDSEAMSEADIETYARAYATPERMRAGFEYYRALPADAETNRETAGTKLRMPVLVIETSEGLQGGLLRGAEAVAEGVRHTTVESARHYVAEEQPAELARCLQAFFQNS